MQIAKTLGVEETAVGRAGKLDVMREAGADHVVDCRSEDFSKVDRRYDRIVDVAGRRSMLPFRRVLRPGGCYVMLGGSMPRLLQVAVVGGVLSRLTEKSMRVMVGNPTREDLTRLANLVVAGEITAMIDRGYSLDEVPEATKYLGE